MIRIIAFGFSVIVTIFFIGCGVSNPIVATIGNDKITLHEFEDNYAKNNAGWDSSAVSTLDERNNFLNLLVKFKLKVKEARNQGLLKDTAIINELESYNILVGKSYVDEKEIIQPGIEQLYNRKKEEIHASHILFRVTPTSKPEDTLKAYERAMNAITQLATTPFDTLAYQLSEDLSAKSNRGDLGLFTAGRMVSEFEDACYSLKPGEYTKKPVRSQFGYHIIKVHAKQPNPGSVRISHILRRFNEELSDTAEVRDTVRMIYNKIKNGEKFEDLMKEYTHDQASIPNNGDLGTYERDRLPKHIGDLFFGMKIGEVSEPVKFNYGYHIFKLSEKKPFPPFAEVYNEIKSQYQQRRYQTDRKLFIQKLKNIYKPIVDTVAVNKFISSIDTTKSAGQEVWKDTLTAEQLKIALIKTTMRQFTVNDFAEKVINSNEYRGYLLNSANVWILIGKLIDEVVTDEYARNARHKHPILASLMKEYEDGVLLYRIEQDEIWKKVMVNDSILREYYELNKENYRWPERVNFAEIFTTADSSIKSAYWRLQYGEDFSEVAEEYSNRHALIEKKGEYGFQPFAYNELSKKASKMAVDSITAPFKHENGWSILKTIAFDEPRIKTFDEAMPEVASQYQEMASKKREKEWLKDLETKYSVAINKEKLIEAFKKKRESK